MERGERGNVWRQFEKLPPERKREVEDFIHFLASRKPARKSPAKPTKSKISQAPFIGMWRDREDMADSVQWVKTLRQNYRKIND